MEAFVYGHIGMYLSSTKEDSLNGGLISATRFENAWSKDRFATG